MFPISSLLPENPVTKTDAGPLPQRPVAATVREVPALRHPSQKLVVGVDIVEGLGLDVTRRARPYKVCRVPFEKLKASGGTLQLQRSKYTAVHGPNMPSCSAPKYAEVMYLDTVHQLGLGQTPACPKIVKPTKPERTTWRDSP